MNEEKKPTKKALAQQENAVTENPSPAAKPPVKRKRRKRSKFLSSVKKQYKNNKLNVITAALTVAFLIITAGLYLASTKVSAAAAADSYAMAYETEKNAVYQELYQQAYDRAEEKYHLSNHVYISIGNLEETETLEVLKVRDSEIITSEASDNSGKINAWLKAEGEGTYTVNLKTAEFVIDQERCHVLVRIHSPELSNINVDAASLEPLWFRQESFLNNGEFSDGVQLANRQVKEARVRIEKSLMSNQDLYEVAKNVAESSIQNLVKQFNPDIPDLVVEVEFMD